MTSQALISKIHCRLSANQKRNSEFGLYNTRQTRKAFDLLQLLQLCGHTVTLVNWRTSCLFLSPTLWYFSFTALLRGKTHVTLRVINTLQTRKAFDLLQLSQLREERKGEETTRNGRGIGCERDALEQGEGHSSGVESQGTNYTSINENCYRFKTATSTASKAKVFQRTSHQIRRQGGH